MPAPFKDDLYATLRVEPGADAGQIKTSYRALVREFHPDANPHCRTEAEARSKEIIEAYAVLGDPQRRAQYDLDLRTLRLQQMPVSVGALITRVRVALGLSADECAMRLGMTSAIFSDLEKRDALPTSPVQTRMFVCLLDNASTALQQRGETMAARELKLDWERKRTRQTFMR